jgi:hypothetical protein
MAPLKVGDEFPPAKFRYIAYTPENSDIVACGTVQEFDAQKVRTPLFAPNRLMSRNSRGKRSFCLLFLEHSLQDVKSNISRLMFNTTAISRIRELILSQSFPPTMLMYLPLKLTVFIPLFHFERIALTY